ncbi:hypothetical protein BD410DRAFT_344669 [Rickenella mellea]|uniref:CASTOR ACT domain-containing protein n=1 Tax=Rickenella mellea TaxID=50990 RepID=A0A4Y7QKC5_9AGAM|nr:hypothetical protein BD410DRAFT_344669 [Rickenella mellea]
MPPPSDHPSLKLQLMPEPFCVLQFSISDTSNLEHLHSLITASVLPSGTGFVSITRTPDEISVVVDVPGGGDFIQKDKFAWKCIKIVGPMDFGLTGVMCDITTPLKAAKIPIFALSTWNTDYILVGIDRFEEAIDVLKADDWGFHLVENH